jgi:hypothetical protein
MSAKSLIKWVPGDHPREDPRPLRRVLPRRQRVLLRPAPALLQLRAELLPDGKVSNVIKRFFPSSLKGRLHRRNALKTLVKMHEKARVKMPTKKNGIVHQTTQAKNARKNATKMPPKCHQNATKMPPKCHQNARVNAQENAHDSYLGLMQQIETIRIFLHCLRKPSQVQALLRQGIRNGDVSLYC